MPNDLVSSLYSLLFSNNLIVILWERIKQKRKTLKKKGYLKI